MNLSEELFSALKPECHTTDIDEVIKHLDNGGKVFHNDTEVVWITKLSFSDGFGRYKGHLSGDWMNGIFILK